MAVYKNHPEHKLTYIEDVTREAPATVNENGNLVVTPNWDVLDVHETSIWCSKCERLTEDELADHGISDTWDVI